MTDKKKADEKTEEKAAERREERLAEQGQADPQQQDAENTEGRVLTEDEAPVNPVEQSTLTANYDPTGQIEQPGMPLHSTDPEQQAAYEEQRREAVLRSQMGEGLPQEETATSDEENRENA